MKFEPTEDKTERIAIVFFTDGRKPHRYKHNLFGKHIAGFEANMKAIGAEYINYYEKYAPDKSKAFMYQQNICRKKKPLV